MSIEAQINSVQKKVYQIEKRIDSIAEFLFKQLHKPTLKYDVDDFCVSRQEVVQGTVSKDHFDKEESKLYNELKKFSSTQITLSLLVKYDEDFNVIEEVYVPDGIYSEILHLIFMESKKRTITATILPKVKYELIRETEYEDS